MWPKMLFEVLPHIGRLVPMAEKFFATRGAREAEEQASLNAMANTLQTELARMSAASTSLQQAFGEQAEQAVATAAEVTRIRIGLEAMDGRLGKLEGGFATALDASERAERAASRVARLFALVLVVLLLIAGLLGYLLLLQLRIGRH
jgi:hypothetical protein